MAGLAGTLGGSMLSGAAAAAESSVGSAEAAAGLTTESQRVNVTRYFVAGESDAGPMLQRALSASSAAKRDLFIPDGMVLQVSQTLQAGNASIVGSAGRSVTIRYTGNTYLFGTINRVEGILFVGPGKNTDAVCFKVQGGYRTCIENCAFDGWGKAVEISGSGQKVCFCTFDNCNYGVHVVKYPNNDPTTTFTSEKNWYQKCNRGLFVDAGGPASNCQSSCSRDDIFQLNTGVGLFLKGCAFPFLLINPHFEQNSARPGWHGFRFENSPVLWLGGYQMGSDVNSVDENSSSIRYGFGGIMAATRLRLTNANASVACLEFDPATNTTTFPANPSRQTTLFSGGGYGATNTARVELQGGLGDNGYRYGSFIQSLRTSSKGHGSVFSVGSVMRGAPNVYSTQLNVDDQGAVYPGLDGAQSLGKANMRWGQIHAATPAISTSGAKNKIDIGDIPDEWLDAWAEVNWVRYKFRDAVALKGGAARWHTGLIAERIEAAFAARGLDARALGLLCWDSWPAQPALHDAAGQLVQPAIPAGACYGIRYEEALALEAALMRRTTCRLEQRLAQALDFPGARKPDS